MKIILSRKGFDSANGGCPSPILPDGTLLSLPIPSNDKIRYSDLQYNGTSYTQLLEQLKPNKNYEYCHLDPDIRKNIHTTPVIGWKPAFGQINAAQGVLANAGVEKGDIFLFFGWFKQVVKTEKGYCFSRRWKDDFYLRSNLQVIYGYMQIGDIITDPDEIAKYDWHPHSSPERLKNHTNALYIPSEHLSLNPELPGYGTLDFRTDRVLTMKNQTRAVWNDLPFLRSEHIYGNKKNSAKGDGLYYAGIWQELVINESEGLIEWVKNLTS